MTFISIPVPQNGESFNSLIMRVAEHNGLLGISEVLDKIGVGRGRSDHASFTKIGEITRVAAALDIPQHEIASRMHPPVLDADDRAIVLFNSVQIRRKFIDAEARRFSPAALRASPCHRKIWDLRPLTFCPQSFEKLLSQCPECETDCTWGGASLINCRVCGCDLRYVPTTKLAPTDYSALCWFASLYSDRSTTREAAWAQFPAELRNLDQVTQIDLLLLFGSLAVDPAEVVCRNELRRLRNGDFSNWSFEKLRAGGDVLRDWPRNFFGLVKTLRAAAFQRNWRYKTDRQRLIGSLAQLVSVKEKHQVLNDIFSPLITEGLARAENKALGRVDHAQAQILIYPKEIHDRYGFSKATIAKLRTNLDLEVSRDLSRGRASAFERERFEKLVALRDNLETCNAISKRTRIPIPALRKLAKDGYLPHAGEEGSLLLNTAQSVFVSNSVEEFFAATIEQYGHPAFEGERLGTYLNFAAFHESGWFHALECVIDGRVKSAVEDKSRKRFAYRILIDRAAMDNFLRKAAEAQPTAIPLGLAACVLKMEARTIGQLAKLNGSKVPLTLDALLNLEKKFSTISQLATELELKRQVVLCAIEASGLAPILPAADNFQPIYVRDDAIRAIENARSRQRRLPLNQVTVTSPTEAVRKL
jgi:hypothetical protein